MNQNTTNTIAIPNNILEKLKLNFPHCFDKNGDFDFAKFKKELETSEVSFSKESYGMDWLGKSYARLLATDPAKTLIKEDKVWNEKPENKNSENLLIKGDNLEVLKHLSNAYHEKMKMIYIDPPYNTGSDGFVYEDDRKFTVEQFSELAGVDEEQAKKILSFVNSKSNSHSAWLTFMYPRLYIAKQLLKDDGVIFISIDDNEVAQLRILMDEIFGEENFVSEFIWEKKKKPSFLHANVGKLTEYIICYVKNNSKTFPFSIESTTEGKKYPFNNAGNTLGMLSFPPNTVKFNIDDGVIMPQDMSEGNIKTRLLNELIIENGYNKNQFNLEGEWRYSQEKLKEIIDNKEEIIISQIPFRPNHIKVGGEIKKMKNMFSTSHYNMETNEDATEQLNSLFFQDIFTNPKPIKLVSTLIKAVTYNDKESIILDFFAGSGTTGDAVMQLNAEDKVNDKEGNRKYILVQLPEPIDPENNKTAFDFVKNELGVAEPTIFEITKERLVRAGKKIKVENIDQSAKSEKVECVGFAGEHCSSCKGEYIIKIDAKKAVDLSKVDFGFKIFEAQPIWEDYAFEAKEFDVTQTLFDESKLSGDDVQTLLTTWKTYDNISLTESLENVNLDGYTGYYGNGKLYLMDNGFETKHLKTLLNKIDEDTSFKPVSIIVFGYHFESKVLREIAENIANYMNKKKLDIDFITRY